LGELSGDAYTSTSSVELLNDEECDATKTIVVLQLANKYKFRSTFL